MVTEQHGYNYAHYTYKVWSCVRVACLGISSVKFSTFSRVLVYMEVDVELCSMVRVEIMFNPFVPLLSMGRKKETS